MNYQSKTKAELIEIINNFKLTINGIRAENIELKQKIKEIEEDEEDYKARRIGELTEKVIELQDENKELKNKVARQEMLEAENEYLENQNDKLEEQVGELKDKLENKVLEIAEPYQQFLQSLEGQFPAYSRIDNEIAFLQKEIDAHMKETLKF